MNANWQTLFLNDVIELVPAVDPTKAPSKEFKYVDVSSISNETFQIEEVQTLLGRDAPSRARKGIRAGDVLFATIRPTLKRIAIVPEHLDGQVCSTGYFVFRAKPSLLPKYLYYHLFTDEFQSAMEGLQTGASYPAVTDAQVRQQPISFPSIAEQRRIVAILDEAFEAIATATASAEKNLDNAREIFVGQLDDVFSNQDQSWPIVNLTEVSDFQGGSQPPKSVFINAPKKGYVRLLQIRDFKSDKYAVYIPESARNKLCGETDIMIGRYGASVGQIHRGKAGAYNVALIKTIPDPSKLDIDFFYYYLRSGIFQGALKGVAARSAQAGFSKEDIAGFSVPLPSTDDQKNIVRSLGTLASDVSKLAQVYEKKISILSDLKQSVLHQAFAGKLLSLPSNSLDTAAE